MRVILALFLFLGFIVMVSLFITKEDGTLDAELRDIKHPKIKALETLHKKFKNLNVHSGDLDVDQAINEIKKARKEYPLDDKLKTLEMELENRRANQTN